MRNAFFPVVFLCLIYACGKSNTPAPPPPTPPPPPTDTIGKGWQVFNTGGTDLFFHDPARGFIFGSSLIEGIKKTIDSGKTWTPIAGTSSLQFVNAFVLNNQFAYAAERSNFVYTNNGGDTWITKPFPDGGFDVGFATPARGIMTSPKGLYLTIDTGQTWQLRMTGTWQGIFFATPSVGWATCKDSGIYKTTDGGFTWTNQKRTANDNYTVFFTDVNRGWYTNRIMGGQFVVWRTNDGGNTWVSSAQMTSAGYADVKFVSPTTGYVTADYSVFKTNDGGATWKLELKSSGATFIDQFFIDSNNVWMLTAGNLYRWRK